jgi:hypothetical protein
MTWDVNAEGVMPLPSGHLIRGRGLQSGAPRAPLPTFGIYLLGQDPKIDTWETRWLKWRDFWLPDNRREFRQALVDLIRRLSESQERIEIACRGGRGRTGTALACLAVLEGVPASEAVDYVRMHYDRRAVETPWQQRFVRNFR